MTDDQLKFLGAALALVISTGTAQFSIASFVNKVRDEFHQKRRASNAGRWCTFSELYDLTWGYLLGVGFNIVFFVVAHVLEQSSTGKQLAGFGRFLWWLYLINLVAWVTGMFIDYVRLFLTRKNQPQDPLSEIADLLRTRVPSTNGSHEQNAIEAVALNPQPHGVGSGDPLVKSRNPAA